MEKNRLFIVISSAAAILGSFLPWGTYSMGIVGSGSISGLEVHSWIVILLAIGSIILACLNNVNTPMSKDFAMGVIVAGAFSTIFTLYRTINFGDVTTRIGDYGVSIGFGLILALITSIAIVVAGLLAMSGGKITKGTFEELAESGKGFAQSVGRVTTSTVKTAVDEIKKESHEHTEGQADQPVEAPKDPNQSEQ